MSTGDRNTDNDVRVIQMASVDHGLQGHRVFNLFGFCLNSNTQ
jgi:hypothetical protein